MVLDYFLGPLLGRLTFSLPLILHHQPQQLTNLSYQRVNGVFFYYFRALLIIICLFLLKYLQTNWAVSSLDRGIIIAQS